MSTKPGQSHFLPSARGCGLDWALPRNHFEGVTNQGHVSYWEKIGEVDCGDGLVLPLHINFSSRRDGGTPSPYLGQGWLLALLESKFVQEGEDRFNMIQPDGLNNLFLRAEKGGSMLNGSSGWKGEIQGGTISAWASCGWKLVFTNGRIASMTTAKGRKLDWVYEGGKVSELREGNATRLKVEYGTDGRVQALDLPAGERILVAQDKKPRVQTVAGQNVITGVDNSLSRLTLADGREQDFSFGTDDKTLPTLNIGNVGNGAEDDTAKRQLSWNPDTKLAVRDGDWIYQITPAKDAGVNAAIARTNTQKQKEYWFRDNANGQEIVQDRDGVKEVKSWFTSGLLNGKLRSDIKTLSNKVTSSRRISYNEKGQPISEIRDNKRYTYSYDKKERFISLSAVNNPDDVLMAYTFDDLGRMSSERTGTRYLEYYYRTDLDKIVNQVAKARLINQKGDSIVLHYIEGVLVQ